MLIPLTFWENLITLQEYGETPLLFLVHTGWRETPKTIPVKQEKTPVRIQNRYLGNHIYLLSLLEKGKEMRVAQGY
jgi:hypothetical protein